MDSFIRRKDTGATYTVGGVHRKYTKYTNIQNTEKYKKIKMYANCIKNNNLNFTILCKKM